MVAVTATVHLSAAVTFFQSVSPSFSSVATAPRAFPSNCLASASVFAPMDVLPFSAGMQPAPPDSPSTDRSNEAGRKTVAGATSRGGREQPRVAYGAAVVLQAEFSRLSGSEPGPGRR